ncbi:MAG: hypothetical protein MZV70_36450 [Desulfobacterales bacterium]|nr:hypothetical protein [Desulfobacterales bacterium]
METNRIITMPELPEAPGGSPTPAIVTKSRPEPDRHPCACSWPRACARSLPCPMWSWEEQREAISEWDRLCPTPSGHLRECRPPGAQARPALRLRLHRRVHSRRHHHRPGSAAGPGLPAGREQQLPVQSHCPQGGGGSPGSAPGRAYGRAPSRTILCGRCRRWEIP